MLAWSLQVVLLGCPGRGQHREMMMRGALGVCNKDLGTCPLLLLEPGKLQTNLGFAFSGRFLKENQPPTYPGSGEAQGPGNCIQGCVLKLDVLHALHGVVLNFQ